MKNVVLSWGSFRRVGRPNRTSSCLGTRTSLHVCSPSPDPLAWLSVRRGTYKAKRDAAKPRQQMPRNLGRSLRATLRDGRRPLIRFDSLLGMQIALASSSARSFFRSFCQCLPLPSRKRRKNDSQSPSFLPFPAVSQSDIRQAHSRELNCGNTFLQLCRREREREPEIFHPYLLLLLLLSNILPPSAMNPITMEV